jgi:hypothetical protein
VCDVTDDTINLGIWENTGDNQNELVWHSLTTHGFSTFGDFDGDGRQEFVAASGPVFVMKCTGDDQYELVYADTTNPYEYGRMFVGGDAPLRWDLCARIEGVNRPVSRELSSDIDVTPKCH